MFSRSSQLQGLRGGYFRRTRNNDWFLIIGVTICGIFQNIGHGSSSAHLKENGENTFSRGYKKGVKGDETVGS